MKTYRLKEDYPRVGKSKYFYNVWYKITNPQAGYIPKEGDEVIRNPFASMSNFAKVAAYALKKPDAEEKMIGHYARQPFNSVRLFFEGNASEYIWDSKEDKGKIIWECRMFLDTLKHGSERIASGKTKEEVHKRVAELLDAAGAVLDVTKTQTEIDDLEKQAVTISKKVRILNNLIRSEA